MIKIRRRIDKNNVGRRTERKEVAIRINKAGLTAKGQQRYSVAVRFTSEGAKKASKNDYAAVELDDETNRMYFVTATEIDGFKLSKSSKSGDGKVLTFTAEDKTEWEKYVGDYDLHKDVNDGSYYIDLPNKKQR